MILISVVSDNDTNILPIFYEFSEQINTHYIIFNKTNKDTLETTRLLQGQNLFRKNNNYKYKLITLKTDFYNNEEINETIKQILLEIQRTNEVNVLFNTTGASFFFSYLMTNQIFKINGKILNYSLYNNEYFITDKDNKLEKHIINKNMDIDTYIILKGYSFSMLEDMNEIINRKDKIFKILKDINRYKNFKDNVEKTEFKDLYNLLITINKDKDEVFYKGIILEEYIYWIIKELNYFDDIKIGITISYKDIIKNEFDILLIKDNNLHTIECKFRHNFEGDMFIYKSYATKEFLNENGKSVIFAITDNRTFTDSDIERAKFNNILIYSTDKFIKNDFVNKIKNFFRIMD